MASGLTMGHYADERLPLPDALQQLREALPCSSSKQQRSEQSSPAAEQRPAKRQRVAADQPVVRAQGVMSWLMVPFVEGSQPHRQAAL